MAQDISNEDRNWEFTKYLKVRLFGLVAEVDPVRSDSERLPMASGIVIESEWGYALVTAGHFLEDVKQWKDEARLAKLSLLVQHQAEICGSVSINLEKNLGSFCKVLDIGFLMLDLDVVNEIKRLGGAAIGRENLKIPAEDLKSFFLIGIASAYCPVTTETIATTREGMKETAWQLKKLSGFAIAISKLQIDREGDEPGTIRFTPIKPFDDYRGTSGGPIIGYADGALIRNFCLVGFQSKQILGGKDQKPVHLIATSAAVAIHVIDGYLQELANSGA